MILPPSVFFFYILRLSMHFTSSISSISYNSMYYYVICCVVYVYVHIYEHMYVLLLLHKNVVLLYGIHIHPWMYVLYITSCMCMLQYNNITTSVTVLVFFRHDPRSSVSQKIHFGEFAIGSNNSSNRGLARIYCVLSVYLCIA